MIIGWLLLYLNVFDTRHVALGVECWRPFKHTRGIAKFQFAPAIATAIIHFHRPTKIRLANKRFSQHMLLPFL